MQSTGNKNDKNKYTVRRLDALPSKKLASWLTGTLPHYPVSVLVHQTMLYGMMQDKMQDKQLRWLSGIECLSLEL